MKGWSIQQPILGLKNKRICVNNTSCSMRTHEEKMSTTWTLACTHKSPSDQKNEVIRKLPANRCCTGGVWKLYEVLWINWLFPQEDKGVSANSVQHRPGRARTERRDVQSPEPRARRETSLIQRRIILRAAKARGKTHRNTHRNRHRNRHSSRRVPGREGGRKDGKMHRGHWDGGRERKSRASSALRCKIRIYTWNYALCWIENSRSMQIMPRVV